MPLLQAPKVDLRCIHIMTASVVNGFWWVFRALAPWLQKVTRFVNRGRNRLEREQWWKIWKVAQCSFSWNLYCYCTLVCVCMCLSRCGYGNLYIILRRLVWKCETCNTNFASSFECRPVIQLDICGCLVLLDRFFKIWHVLSHSRGYTSSSSFVTCATHHDASAWVEHALAVKV